MRLIAAFRVCQLPIFQVVFEAVFVDRPDSIRGICERKYMLPLAASQKTFFLDKNLRIQYGAKMGTKSSSPDLRYSLLKIESSGFLKRLQGGAPAFDAVQGFVFFNIDSGRNL